MSGNRVSASGAFRKPGFFIFLALLVAGGCAKAKPPARQYTLHGQVLAVNAGANQLTIKHEDIPGLMPAMTMSYPVATPGLLQGRKPGELITATLEVTDSAGTLTAITDNGMAPLPKGTNEVAMAEGILAEGDQAPDAAFIDQDNQRRAFSDWKGTLTLVTFFYTACPLPNFCPLLTDHFATIARTGAADPSLKGRFKLVEISFDPDHDTPAVLHAYALAHDANPAVWTFLTADTATVDRFAGRFGVGVLRDGGADGITHNLRTVLIGADGKVLKIYTGNDWTPKDVVADMRAALAHS